MAAEPLYLTILRQGDTITVDLTEVAPVVPRSQVQIEEGLLTEIGEELARITTLANRSASLDTARPTAGADTPDSFHTALQRLGGLIFSHLFPAPACQRLAGLTPTDLFLRLDDQLVHVPWELAFDGRDFLCTKFRIGRQIITVHRPAADHVPRPQAAEPLRMLIIVDPTESLDSAAQEAEQLCDLLDACSNLEVSVIGGKRLRKLDLLQALNECDLAHYAGHAFFDPVQPSRSGWLLHETVLTASEISRVAHPPLLVFSNACQAGVTTRWQAETIYEGQAFGIGSAFLLAGVQNYIGTFCVIHDAHSAAFAADFYRHLLGGKRLGAALAAARDTARQASDQRGLLWASYMHYGNPSFRLPIGTSDPAGALDPRPYLVGTPAPQVMTDATTVYRTPPHESREATPGPGSSTPETPPAPEASAAPPADARPGRGRFGGWKQRLAVAAGICLVFAGLLAVFWPRQPEDAWTSRPLTLALLPLERKGAPSAGADRDALVEAHIAQVLQGSGRLKVVERTILEKLLAELKLGTSDLADPQAALRVGRLLAARLIATGSVKYVGAGMQLTLRVIETETTDTPATEAETVDKPEALNGVVAHLARNLLHQIRQAYPLQGRITHITSQDLLLLNIGAQHGVTSGLSMLVFGRAESLDLETPVAQLVVTHVEAGRSQAKVLQATLPLQLGWRVKEGQAK